MSKKYYIGIASTFHDPSLSIIDENGQVIFAEGTERYLQEKRAMGCPADPVVWSNKLLKKYCNPDAEFHIASTWSNLYVRTLKFFDVLGFLNLDPSGWFSKFFYDTLLKNQLPDHNLSWMMRKMHASNVQSGASLERNLRINLGVDKIVKHRFSHHLCHAATGAYGSGYEDAFCLIVDGMGERGSISFFDFKNDTLIPKGENMGMESLGFFYAFLTILCAFDPVEGEEWKVMGMSSYGKFDKAYYNLLDSIISIEGTKIRFKSSPAKIKAIQEKINEEIRNAKDSFTVKANIAHTGQVLFSEYMIRLIQNTEKLSTSKNLVLAGGCGLNSAFNGSIVGKTRFGSVYVPSAPGDDGNSLGAAFLAFKKVNPSAALPRQILSPYLGSTISDKDIQNFITFSGYEKIRHCPGTIHTETARLLAEGKLIGWAQGRAEFGPRSLGNRAILADPRTAEMKDTINARVKFREEFRPFAPSILAEYGPEYFENYQESPYMERTLRFKEEVKHKVPAVVHVDGTGRLQTVKKEMNEKYYNLISSFNEITGVPVVLNTSFNVMGKPIIHSFNDALNVFFNSGLDVLAVNDYLIYK